MSTMGFHISGTLPAGFDAVTHGALLRVLNAAPVFRTLTDDELVGVAMKSERVTADRKRTLCKLGDGGIYVLGRGRVRVFRPCGDREMTLEYCGAGEVLGETSIWDSRVDAEVFALEPTVFVVDDDPGVRNSLSTLLRSIHLPVETYETAQGFLKHVDPSRPGCLILDLRMPSTTGIELQERLLERKFTLPHIFITAYGDVPTAVQAMHAGAFYFLENCAQSIGLIDERLKGCLKMIRLDCASNGDVIDTVKKSRVRMQFLRDPKFGLQHC